jgi:hypothetical protein
VRTVVSPLTADRPLSADVENLIQAFGSLAAVAQ